MFAGKGGDADGQGGDVVDVEPHSVETVGDVYFEESNWAEARVGVDHLRNEPFKGSTELHGFARGQKDGVAVNAGEAVINNWSWASLVLWNDAHGGDPQVRKVAQLGIR